MKKSIIKTITSKLFEGSVSRKRVAPMQASLVLALLLCLLMPQKGWADIVTTTYDFQGSINAGNTTVTMGAADATYTNCLYFTQIGNVQGADRFAAQGDWILTDAHKQGLYSNNTGGRRFLVSKLSSSDVVTFDVVDVYGNAQTISLESTNATASGNTFTMTGKGSLVVNITRYWNIKSITIQHDDAAASWNYDPAKEIYDLTQVSSGGLASNNLAPADYQLNGGTAQYLTNLNGMAANNRITVTGTDNWTFDGGLKNNTDWNVLNLSISNLLAEDRVRIIYQNGNGNYGGNQLNFGSDNTNGSPVLNSAAFKDTNSDGELNEDEHMITRDEAVGSGVYYTMTEDGHLDLIVFPGVKITKIEIYSDHQAVMLDLYNGSAATGYTAYFSQTGQLIAKEHVVPGGLNVYVGNSDDTQHAEVVMSDRGPVSFVYDQGHYKMARQSGNSMNVDDAIPATGTFYKFIPEVDGYMSMNFKAVSIRYANYWNGNGQSEGNEQIKNQQCPYYLMQLNGNTFGKYVHPNGNTENGRNLNNGASGNFNNIRVEAGKTYYMYGWWNGTELGSENVSCGVAHLIDVTFIPDNMITPLAKWEANTNWVNSSEYVEVLADVTGFTTNDLHIKKTSASIDGCTPYIEDGKLKITGVTFKDGANPGGTILIKLGDPSNDANPVFAYTIAYDANWQSSNWTDNSRSEGHTWDFSTNPLRGLEWTNTSGQADDVDFGTEAGPGLLYDEMHEQNPDGTVHSDWMKTYRVINSSGTGTHDLMFLNKYDMEGDNADMMWDTEGIIINTSSNQSCINNEFGSVVDHSKTGTRNDPDRYVGILPGGSFTIPALKAGDRVCIFMGSGDGSGADACRFNITGALDAIGQTISSTDIYNAGGSHWQYNMGNESRYRGAYQFISTGGDMTFTMNGGSMTKLYSITIYTGVKSATNDATKYNYDMSYNGDEYIASNNAWYMYNDYRTETPARSVYTVHYRGKGERLKTPVVLYKSGNINTDENHLIYTETGDNNAPVIIFKSEKEQYGMFRMRIEDYELNYKYVADYGLQNIALGYLEKKNYPYTWDFTDLKGYADTSTRIQKERTNVGNYDPRTVDANETYEIEFMNNSVGVDVKSIEQWKQYAKDGDIPAGYGLHVRNENFNGGVMWESGQLYAGDEQFGEALGLRISAPGVDQAYNGGLRITDEGLCLTGGNWKITIPEVGATNAVYVRAKEIGNAIAGVGAADNPFTFVGTANDGTEEMIYAVKGTGADMDLFFNNVIIKKIAISEDAKTVNSLGFASESRNKEIDPELMGYMTGTGLKAYTVSKVEYDNKPGEFPTVTLTAVNMNTTTNKKYVIGPATHHDNNAYIIYNTDETTKAVKILDNGFHLFVPDMHDKSTADSPQKEVLPVSGNGLRAWLPEYDSEDPDYDVMSQTYNYSTGTNGSITATGAGEGVNDYTTYVLSSKGTNTVTNVTETDVERFRRVKEGTHAGTNKAYLPLLTAKVKPSTNNGNQAKGMFAIVFVDEEEGTETTSLDGVESIERTYDDGSYYTLGGVKVQNPTKKGIYIKNGKKVVIK